MGKNKIKRIDIEDENGSGSKSVLLSPGESVSIDKLNEIIDILNEMKVLLKNP